MLKVRKILLMVKLMVSKNYYKYLKNKEDENRN